jgi:hypothetical protein
MARSTEWRLRSFLPLAEPLERAGADLFLVRCRDGGD